MRLITGLILGFTPIWMNAQIQDIEIDFSKVDKFPDIPS